MRNPHPLSGIFNEVREYRIMVHKGCLFIRTVLCFFFLSIHFLLRSFPFSGFLLFFTAHGSFFISCFTRYYLYGPALYIILVNWLYYYYSYTVLTCFVFISSLVKFLFTFHLIYITFPFPLFALSLVFIPAKISLICYTHFHFTTLRYSPFPNFLTPHHHFHHSYPFLSLFP